MKGRPPPIAFAWLALGACALLTTCRPADREGEAGSIAGDSITVVDATGRRLVLGRPVRRIISLVPSATATLEAIGARDALVGRTDFDTQAWANALPSVGGGLEPSLEAVVALQPDLVVRFAGEQDPRTRERLDELDISYVTVRPDGLADIFETIRLLGRVTGREQAADSLERALRSGLDEIAQAAAALPRLRVAYVLGGTPPWVAGPGTYIDEVLSMIGGDNVFSDLGVLYTAVSPEELRTRDIEVVLVSSSGDFDGRLTPGARLVAIGDALEIPGPRVVEAAREVAELMHGRPLR